MALLAASCVAHVARQPRSKPVGILESDLELGAPVAPNDPERVQVWNFGLVPGASYEVYVDHWFRGFARADSSGVADIWVERGNHLVEIRPVRVRRRGWGLDPYRGDR